MGRNNAGRLPKSTKRRVVRLRLTVLTAMAMDDKAHLRTNSRPTTPTPNPPRLRVQTREAPPPTPPISREHRRPQRSRRCLAWQRRANHAETFNIEDGGVPTPTHFARELSIHAPCNSSERACTCALRARETAVNWRTSATASNRRGSRSGRAQVVTRGPNPIETRAFAATPNTSTTRQCR